MPYDLQSARQAGATDDQILGYLAKNQNYDVDGAMKSGASKDQVLNYLASNDSSQTPPTAAPGPWASGYVAPRTQLKANDPNYVAPKPTMLTAPGDTLKNSLSSVIGGFSNAVMHPIDTAKNVAGVVAGIGGESAPTGSYQHEMAPVSQAVGEHFKQEAIHPLTSLNEDPFGTIADVGALAAPAELGLRGAAEIADAANAARAVGNLRTAADVAGNVSTYSNLPGAAGKAAGYGLSKGIGAITGVRSGLTPVEQAAVDYAFQDPALRDTVDVGTATGNKAIGAQKSLLRKFPTSAGVMSDAELAQRNAISGKMNAIASGVSPQGPTHIFTSGQQILAAIKQKLNQYSAIAKDAFENRLYGAAEANPVQVQTGTRPGPNISNPAAAYDPSAPPTIPGPDVPVYESIAGPTDMTAVKAAAQPILDQLQQQMRATRTTVSPVTSMLEDIVNGPDVVSLKTAKNNISAIQDLARNEVGTMRKKAQALSSQLISPFHDAIDDAARAVGPGAHQALQDGNDATRAKYDLAKAIPNSYLQKDVPPANLVQLHDLLTKNEDAQFPALQKVASHIPQALPGIARATIEDIFRDVTQGGGISKVQTAINRWNDLGPRTKELLFGPQTSADVKNLLQYAKMAVNEANPSGTAPTAQLMGLWALMAHNPIAAIGVMAGARGLAKGIMSPEMADAVRTTGRVPLPSPGHIAGTLAAPVASPGYLNVGRAANAGANPYRPQQ